MDKLLRTRALLSAALLTSALPAVAEINFAIDGGLRQENNIGLAPVGRDKVDDLTAKVAANASWALVQSAQTEVSLNGGLYYDRVDDISDISRKGFTLGAMYRGQATPDLTALFWLVDGEFRWLDYKDSDIRDGYEYKLSARIGKRFNERFTLMGGYRYESRTSDDNNPNAQPANWNAEDVFDLDKDGPFARAEFDATPNTVLFAEYSRMSGDVAATGRAFSQGATFDRAWDYAFGPAFIVWKINADQDIFDVGVKQQFTDRFNMEFSYSHMDASGSANNDYKNDVFTLSVNFGLGSI